MSVLLEIASLYEPKIRKAMILAFNALREKYTSTEIARILVFQGPSAVIQMFDDVEEIIGSATLDIIDSAIKSGGSSTLSVLPAAAVLKPNVAFDLLNPLTLQYIQTYRLNLISQISENTLNTIRQLLYQDASEGVNPITTARKLKNSLGLTERQEQAVRNYQRYLQDLDSEALQRALRDKRFDSTILNAIKNNKPLSEKQIEKMVNRYRERYIQYRAQVISRTEALRVASIGNRQSILQLINSGAIDEERIRKFWVYTKDKRTRETHRRIPSMNPKGRRLKEPYTTPLGPMQYPRDPAGTAENTVLCRCTETYKYIPLEEAV